MEKHLKTEDSLSPSERNKLHFEQYKLLAETVNKNNDMREMSNNFWTTVNIVLISGIAYIKDAKNMDFSHKSVFLWIAISLGFILCFTWLKYLLKVKKVEETGTSLLAELEAGMPYKIFTRLNLSKLKEGSGSLTFTEIMVPLLFFIGYTFFMITLLFFNEEAISPTS